MTGSARIHPTRGSVIIAPGGEDMVPSAEALAAFVSQRDDLMLMADVGLAPASQIARRKRAMDAKIIIQIAGHSAGPFAGGPGLSAIDLEAFRAAAAERRKLGKPPILLMGVFRPRAHHPALRGKAPSPQQMKFFTGLEAGLQGAEFESDAALIEKAAAWISTGFLLRRLPSGHGGFDAPVADIPERGGMKPADIIANWTALEARFL